MNVTQFQFYNITIKLIKKNLISDSVLLNNLLQTIQLHVEQPQNISLDQILHNLEYDIQAPEADQIEKSPKAPLSKSKITSKTDSSRFISFDEEDIVK